jgi:hypothetical protein
LAGAAAGSAAADALDKAARDMATVVNKRKVKVEADDM